jgi:CheY-like chemotaxis protein
MEQSPFQRRPSAHAAPELGPVSNALIPIDLVQFVVADDSPLVRCAVGESLRSCGAREFHAAQDGVEALDYLRRPSIAEDEALVRLVRQQNNIADNRSLRDMEFGSVHSYCVITNFKMRNGTGLDVLKAVRCGETAIPRNTPVIFLTECSSDLVITAALELDVSAFILKPASQKSLKEKLRRALAGTVKLKKREAYRKVRAADEKTAACRTAHGIYDRYEAQESHGNGCAGIAWAT